MDRSPPYSTIDLHTDNDHDESRYNHSHAHSHPDSESDSEHTYNQWADLPPLPRSALRPCIRKGCLKPPPSTPPSTPCMTPSSSSSSQASTPPPAWRPNIPGLPLPGAGMRLNLHPRHPSYEMHHSSPSQSSCRKVTFPETPTCDVHTAPKYDRTPTEPARTPLSYQDMLEVKAILRQLPLADQPPDSWTGRPASRFLGRVPIGLLPLYDNSHAHAHSNNMLSPEAEADPCEASALFTTVAVHNRSSPPPPPRKKGKKKVIMMINDMEVEMEESEDEDDLPPPPSPEPLDLELSTPPLPSSSPTPQSPPIFSLAAPISSPPPISPAEPTTAAAVDALFMVSSFRARRAQSAASTPRPSSSTGFPFPFPPSSSSPSPSSSSSSHSTPSPSIPADDVEVEEDIPPRRKVRNVGLPTPPMSEGEDED